MAGPRVSVREFITGEGGKTSLVVEEYPNGVRKVMGLILSWTDFLLCPTLMAAKNYIFIIQDRLKVIFIVCYLP